MKKLVSVLLASAMVLSIASCSSKESNNESGRGGDISGDSKQEYGIETYPEISIETDTSETEEETTTTTTEETTEAGNRYGKVTDYVIDVGADYDLGSGKYHVPFVTIDSTYTKQMREEIDGIFNYYHDLVAENGDCHYTATYYLACLSPDGIISIVFVERGDWDDNVYHVWNIDCVTGLKVDNQIIADLAGIPDIRTAAMDAVQIYINSRGEIKCDNYEVIAGADHYRQPTADTFSEERINDNMMMGVTDDGTVFFISGVVALGGAEWYYEIYDINGNDLEYWNSAEHGLEWVV